MKETDWKKTLEVIVKGLVAVVVGLAALYILGWVLSSLGGLLLGMAGIIVALLRWLVPVAIIVGIVYFAVTLLRGNTPTAKTAESFNREVVVPAEIPVENVPQAPLEKAVQLPETPLEEAAQLSEIPLEELATQPEELEVQAETKAKKPAKKPIDDKEA